MRALSSLRDKISKSNVSFLVGFIVVLFGTGSWVSVNGLWVELPILVSYAPEKWKLPSYLAIIIQLGNIGPLVYTIGNKYAPNIFQESLVTHVIITVGAIACALLGFLWKETSVTAGAEHSTALFGLVFLLSLVSCTSSVTFLPFMGKFKSQYIVIYFVGQGVSGLLPSLVALIQGVGSSSIKCRKTSSQTSYNANYTSNSTNPIHQLVRHKDTPLFSADAFFFFLLVIMLLCEIAFLLLNYLPKAKMQQLVPKKKQCAKFKTAKGEQKPLDGGHASSATADADPEPSELMELELNSMDKDSQSSLVSDTVYIETVEDTNDSPTLSMRMLLLVLILQAVVNGICNGVIPSVLSYACLPYGEKTYHLALTLSAIANPIASFLFFAVALNSVQRMVVWTLVYSALSAYVIGIAASSPCPPLQDNAGGSFLIVSISFPRICNLNYRRKTGYSSNKDKKIQDRAHASI